MTAPTDVGPEVVGELDNDAAEVVGRAREADIVADAVGDTVGDTVADTEGEED
jgi:hypothetical protein